MKTDIQCSVNASLRQFNKDDFATTDTAHTAAICNVQCSRQNQVGRHTDKTFTFFYLRQCQSIGSDMPSWRKKFATQSEKAHFLALRWITTCPGSRFYGQVKWMHS